MLKEQNDELAKTLGKTIVRERLGCGKATKLGLIK